MRFRKLEELVTQLSGGGTPDPTQRILRKTTSDPLFPQNDDADVLDMLALPNGTTFIATKSPDKDVRVELLVTLTTAAGDYAAATPFIRKADGTGQQTLDRASAQVEGGGGSFQHALSFVIPAGWEYTVMLENSAVDPSSKATLQSIHETPLG